MNGISETVVLTKLDIYVFISLTIMHKIGGSSCRDRNGSWIYNYLCNHSLPALKLQVRSPFMERCTRYIIM